MSETTPNVDQAIAAALHAILDDGELDRLSRMADITDEDMLMACAQFVRTELSERGYALVPTETAWVGDQVEISGRDTCDFEAAVTASVEVHNGHRGIAIGVESFRDKPVWVTPDDARQFAASLLRLAMLAATEAVGEATEVVVHYGPRPTRPVTGERAS